MIKISARIELGQIMLWFVLLFMCLIISVFTLFSNSTSARTVLWLSLLLFGIITFVYSKVNTISFSGNNIIISNIYRKKEIKKENYFRVELVYNNINMFVPLPLSSPPYFALVTTTGERYIFLQASRTIFSLLTVTPEKQALKLNNQIKENLSG